MSFKRLVHSSDLTFLLPPHDIREYFGVGEDVQDITMYCTEGRRVVLISIGINDIKSILLIDR